jgi:hypothetical protein
MGLRGPHARPVQVAGKGGAKRRGRPASWRKAGLTRAERIVKFIEGLKIRRGLAARTPPRKKSVYSSGLAALLARLTPMPLRRRGARIVELVGLAVAASHSALFEREKATVCRLAADSAPFVWIVWLLIGAGGRQRHQQRESR